MLVGKEKNDIIATPQPVLYKSLDTRDNRHTGLYIADELKAGINDLGPQKVFALVTDNAAIMKAAWAKVEESYPHITPIGSAAHALNHFTVAPGRGNCSSEMHQKA